MGLCCMLCLVSYVWFICAVVDCFFFFFFGDLGFSIEVVWCGVLCGFSCVWCHIWMGVQGLCDVFFGMSPSDQEVGVWRKCAHACCVFRFCLCCYV